MTATHQEAIIRRARELLRPSGGRDHHLGTQPLASQLTGPMRRDYRLERFANLAGSTASRDRPTARA